MAVPNFALQNGGIVECQAGKPPPAVAVGVSEHSAVDQREKLDRAAAEDDGQRRDECMPFVPVSLRWRPQSSLPLVSLFLVRSKISKTEIMPMHLCNLSWRRTRQMSRDIVKELSKYRQWAIPQLEEVANDKSSDSKEKLHASLALVGNDPSKVDYLADRLLTGKAEEVPVIVRFLSPYKDRLNEQLWQAVKSGSGDNVFERRRLWRNTTRRTMRGKKSTRMSSRHWSRSPPWKRSNGSTCCDPWEHNLSSHLKPATEIAVPTEMLSVLWRRRH